MVKSSLGKTKSHASDATDPLNQLDLLAGCPEARFKVPDLVGTKLTRVEKGCRTGPSGYM